MDSHIRVVATLALVAVCAEPAGAQATFTRVDYRSSSGTRAIATADFNRDGWIDVALASSDTNSVEILLNAAGRSAVRGGRIAVGTGPFDMTAADFNRDGRVDLAVAAADVPTGALGSPRGVAAGDVNVDGKPDLVYTAHDSNAMQVLLGDGAGAFTKAPPIPTARQPQGIIIADFDRDGRPDLAVAHDSGVTLWRGTTAGTFTATPIAGAFPSNVLAAADFDGNGWLDIAAASTTTGRVAIYGGGAAGLSYRRAYGVDADLRGIAVADVDGNGVADILAVSRGSSTVSVLPGNQAQPGTFLPRLAIPAMPGSRAISAADFDGDGRIDVAVGNQYASSASLLANTSALVRAAYTFRRTTIGAGSGLVSTSPLAAADFNRDGRLDVVSRSGDSASGFDAVTVLLSGQPGLRLPGPFPFAGVVVADFDRDDSTDLLYIASDSANLGEGVHTKLLTYRNDGRGAFAAAATWTSTVWMRRCVTADINRDARVDLVCIGFDDAAAAHLVLVAGGNGDGSFAAATRTVLPDYPVDVQVADVDRDGAVDVVVLASAEALWLRNRDGRLAVAGSVGLPAVSYPQHLRAADVNHDARTDLLVAGNDGELAVALGTSSGFAAPAVSAPLQVGGAFEVVDVDVDGDPDVVAPGALLRGGGDGTFAAAEAFAFWGPLTVADVTRDGLPDILAHAGDGVLVLENERNAVNHPPVLSAANRTFEYHEIVVDPLGEFDCPALVAEATDPDQHAVTFEWRDENDALVSVEPDVHVCSLVPGTYTRTVTVRDGRGAASSQRVTLTIRPGKEIVVYAVNLTGDDDVWLSGEWKQVTDPTGAGGFRASDADSGAAKTAAPAAAAASAVTIKFTPDPTQTYKLWVRLKAERNSYANDSIWVQFSGAVDSRGAPVYRIGTTAGLAVNLEECSGCGVSGWGWEDDGWGAVGRNGVTLRFPDGGRQTILIQTREDGVSVDQVVLSADKYFSVRPGQPRNDQTILPRTYQVNPH